MACSGMGNSFAGLYAPGCGLFHRMHRFVIGPPHWARQHFAEPRSSLALRVTIPTQSL
jgi:hypothetical protein